jgi:aminomethyltransferase
MSETMEEIKSLPLIEFHRRRKAKIANFAGWEVPLYFTTILQEHEKVRTAVGLFDISHMGYFTIKGTGSRSFLDSLLSGKFANLTVGKAIYSLLTNEAGGIVDDVILYQRGEDDYFLIVNAGRLNEDWEWLNSHLPDVNVELKNLSDEKVFFAVQGPAAEKVASTFTGLDLSKMGRFEFTSFNFQGKEVTICRTGYTGEDGFEVLAPKSIGPEMWEGFLQVGKNDSIEPIGFGARDSLRLEARYPLYGHELNMDITPVEAGLNFAVDFEKQFTGSEIIKSQKKNGISKRLVGFEVEGRQIPREGYPLFLDGQLAGKVTSGLMSPTLKKNIGLGFVDSSTPVSEGLSVEVRGQQVPCKVIKGPFYTSPSLKKLQKK